jgi:hypothetical protein
VPTRELPNWLVRVAALRDLGWAPRSNEEAIVATAESLVLSGC